MVILSRECKTLSWATPGLAVELINGVVIVTEMTHRP